MQSAVTNGAASRARHDDLGKHDPIWILPTFVPGVAEGSVLETAIRTKRHLRRHRETVAADFKAKMIFLAISGFGSAAIASGSSKTMSASAKFSATHSSAAMT